MTPDRIIASIVGWGGAASVALMVARGLWLQLRDMRKRPKADE